MKIIPCNCKSEFQDETYGKGNRVANEMRSGQLRCIVCGTIHGSSTAVPQRQPKIAAEKPAVTKKPEEKKKDNKGKEKKGSLKGGKR